MKDTSRLSLTHEGLQIFALIWLGTHTSTAKARFSGTADIPWEVSHLSQLVYFEGIFLFVTSRSDIVSAVKVMLRR
jgi:hypothetical protein